MFESKRNQLLRVFLALFGISCLIWAQTETGQIAGTVTDPTGAAIANASVRVVSTSTDTVRTTTSSGAGDFTVANLLPGEYNVRVTSPGFSNFQQRVVVTVGTKVGIDVKMQIGATGTTIEVSEAAVRVNTETQTLSQTISSQDVALMPTISRNPYDLVKTIGNVSDDPGQRGVGVSINGQRASSTAILLDGVSNANAFDTTVAIIVPQDSINEFSVVTSDFTAEYGGASGGVVNVVTKAGTNSLHGSVYEFNRVSDLASNTFNNNAFDIPKPVFTRNQFGFSIAGPIIKDKLFFFDNAEWTRVRSLGPVVAVVPTPALIAASAPATQAFFAAAGQLKPNLAVSSTFTAADVGCTTAACAALGATPAYETVIYHVPTDAGGGTPQNTWNDVGRIDYNLSDRTQMYFRYARYVENDFVGTFDNSPYTGYDTASFTDSQGYALSITHAFSPKQVSQTKLSYNRISLVEPLGAQPVSPTLYTSLGSAGTLGGNAINYPGYTPGLPGSAIPFGGPQNEASINEDYSITVGKHDFRFGGVFTYLQDNRVFGAYEEAVEALGTGDTGSAANNLTLGQLNQFQAAVYPQGKYPCIQTPTGPTVTPACTLTLPVAPPSFSRSNRFRDAGLYTQDSWKLRPTFTLNLGLRWEYFGPPANSKPALNSNFYLGTGANVELQSATGVVLPATQAPGGNIWAKQWANFAPRVGFAWDVMGDGKTSIRGGYGIGYERNFNNVTFNVIQNPPNYGVVALQAGVDVPTIPITFDNAGPLAGSSGTKPLGRVTLRAVDPNIKNAYAHSWSFSIERQLSKDAIFGLDYSGSAGENLYTIDRLNLPGSAPVYAGITTESRINPQYSTINYRTNGGNSIYNGLNTRFELRNFRQYGLTLRANYTWSHSIDDASSTFTASDNLAVANLGLLDPLHPSLDRGDSDFDVRHRVVVAAVWQSPFFSKPGLTNLMLGGWNLSPIFTAHTGSPFSIYDSTNSDGNLFPRLMLGNPQYKPQYTDVSTGRPNEFTYLDLTGADINSSYINPLSGTSDFGPFPDSMTGRNAFRKPGAWTFNLGASKTFSLTERFKLDLRAEAFDIFNHSNVYLVGNFENLAPAAAAGGGFAGTVANPLLPNITTTRGINNSSGFTGFSVNNGRLENRNLQLALRLSF